MRKYQVLLCSVLSVASVAWAQPPSTSGTPAVIQTGSMVAATSSVAHPSPMVSSSGAETATAVPTNPAASPAPTPVSIEMPLPIEPPKVPVAPPTTPAISTEPAPIPPPTQPTAESTIPAIPAPAVPGSVTAPSTGMPGTAVPPGTQVPVNGSSIASAAMVAVAPGGRSVQDFQGDDIGQVLRLLARQAGINLVVSDMVAGTITMRLENKTPLEAIGVIVTAKGLSMDEINGVYYIKTSAEKQREPTESANYTFSYATAEKVSPLLASQIQSGIAPMFDVRTNTIYYREFKSNLTNIKLFLETVDRPTQQVMIEARLVEVTANPQQSYGINWGGVVGSAASPMTLNYGASAPGSNVIKDSTQIDVNTGLPKQVAAIGTLPAVTTGASGATLQNFLFNGSSSTNFLKAIGGQFAILSAPQLSLTMRLLNEDADAEFLANPRVVTANNLMAKIKITRAQPVPQLNFNEQTAQAVFSGFSDKEFGNTLTVTPTINKDDFVTMLVKPEISNKIGDQPFQFQGVNLSSPIIDTRALESTVLIKSGDTLAIGGLLQDEVNKQRTKVPVMGDIPIIGYAFQERLNKRVKRNLLVFVTPTIIKQGYGTGLEDQVSGLKSSGEEFADPNGWRNNAKGAVRVVPTSNRPVGADYPKPGVPPAPETGSLYKVSAPSRE